MNFLNDEVSLNGYVILGIVLSLSALKKKANFGRLLSPGL